MTGVCVCGHMFYQHSRLRCDVIGCPCARYYRAAVRCYKNNPAFDARLHPKGRVSSLSEVRRREGESW